MILELRPTHGQLPVVIMTHGNNSGLTSNQVLSRRRAQLELTTFETDLKDAMIRTPWIESLRVFIMAFPMKTLAELICMRLDIEKERDPVTHTILLQKCKLRGSRPVSYTKTAISQRDTKEQLSSSSGSGHGGGAS